MKQQIAHIIIMLLTGLNAWSQTTVTGTVTDGREPLAGANVFIMGTIDGCMTDSLGRFSFKTSQTGELTLRATFMGFDDYTLTTTQPTALTIRMKERATAIDEVVVTASTYSFGKSDNFKTMDAHDVVMTGNSCGDIVAALQSLPGTQKVGEDGKLYVRGGESDECQTFVNGMHVLVPYSTGYGGEYGQALSSVLPMETTDVATADKLGVSGSLVDWNIGGTKAFTKSSLSFNADYTSMGLYNALFPDRYDWMRPYRKLSTEAQYKADFSAATVLKTYVGYDLTSVGQYIDERSLSMTEHNVYANATLKTNIGHGYTLFAGMANSTVINHVDDALMQGDHYRNTRNEVHLKGELRKVFSPVLKIQAGVEDYIRHSTKHYEGVGYGLDYQLLAAHTDVQLRLMPKLFLNLSARLENATYDGRWLLMPRATLSYVPNKRFQLSAMVGRYSQTANDDYIAMSAETLRQSTADHAILSMQYSNNGTLLRIEPYYKKYRHLPLLREGIYTAEGYGTSRGLDIFVENHSLVKHLTTTFSYSFNDSERLYLDYATPQTPSYASRHNLRLSLKYGLGKIIIGLSESYASKRHYPNGDTPYYNSIDANITWLVSPKVIVYTSLSNILGRTNIFGYEADGKAITATRDRFLYIGIFVSLKNNKAYDISNF